MARKLRVPYLGPGRLDRRPLAPAAQRRSGESSVVGATAAGNNDGPQVDQPASGPGRGDIFEQPALRREKGGKLKMTCDPRHHLASLRFREKTAEPVMHFAGSETGSAKGAPTSQPRATPWVGMEQIQSPEPERCRSKWGAHASGVWFAASRRKPRHTHLLHQTVRPRGGDDADGATPSAARGTRALPNSNYIVPV